VTDVRFTPESGQAKKTQQNQRLILTKVTAAQGFMRNVSLWT
jgi:hypothetical protein